MNKNLFLGMLAATGMLFATSCSNDELNAVQSGDEAQVTFSLGAEGGIASRAISDGKTANKLIYAVFNSAGEPLSVFDENGDGVYEHQKIETIGDITENTHEVTITLAKGQTYQVAFWTQNSACGAYSTDDLRAVSVSYKEAKNNDENRDAFFKTEIFKVKGNETRKVELKRPFAQINVGVTEADWTAAVQSGVNITESKVVIKNAATTINLLDGTVSGEEVVTYNFATIPAQFTEAETLEVDVNRDNTIQDDEKYKYLSMSYILTSAERTTLESDGLQFTFSPAFGEDIVFDEGLHAVPVQRNWRTNILGKILTGDITFEVIIVPEYEDDYNVLYPDNKEEEVSVVSVTTAQDLTDAIKNATKDITIYFANNITGNVTALQKADVDVVINGNGFKYTGTIEVQGGGRSTGAETLTIENVDFVIESDADADFITTQKKVNGAHNYAHNVTVRNCSFTASGNGDVVAVRHNQSFNSKIENCTATGLHSLMWATGGTGVAIDGVNLSDCKYGIHFGTVTGHSIKNSTITTTGEYGYAVRVDASGSLSIENCTLTAAAPVLIRYSTAGSTYDLTLSGTNTLTATGDYQIVPTETDFKEGEELPYAIGNITITGAEDFKVYSPKGVFEAALADPNVSDITLTDPIVSVGTGFEVTKDMVFNMDGKEFNAGSTANSTWYALEVSGENKVIVNEANFTRAGIVALAGADVVFNSGSINHKPERTSRYIFCARNEGTTITVKDGTFTNDRARNSFFWADDNAVIYVEGGIFNGAVSNNKVYTSNGGKVIISGGTFNFDPTAWLAEDYTATTVDNKTWTVIANK